MGSLAITAAHDRSRSGRNMKLHWSPRSPFVRKVMIAAHERGIANRVELVRTVVLMTTPNEALIGQSDLQDPGAGPRRRHASH